MATAAGYMEQPILPICIYQYASVEYETTVSVGRTAGQYVKMSPGEYVHLTRGEDNMGAKMMRLMDAQVQRKWAQVVR